MAKNTERVCYHLCAVIALLIMAGCRHVHVWLLKWVDFHTRTTFHKMPSADVFCWMNTFVTDCLICPLHCDWCEDKQILRHACFCFRVSFFWLSSDFYLRSDGISACLSLAFLRLSPHLTRLSSLQVTSYTNELNSSERITCQSPSAPNQVSNHYTIRGWQAWTEWTLQLSKPVWQNQINDCCVTVAKQDKTESKVDFHLFSGIFK